MPLKKPLTPSGGSIKLSPIDKKRTTKPPEKSPLDTNVQRKRALAPINMDIINRLSKPRKKPSKSHVIYPSSATGRWSKPSGGRFSTAKPKTHTEILMLRAAETPGPNQYVINDSLTSPGTGGAVIISDANPKSDIDWVILNSSQTPGLNEYTPDKDISTRLSGGRFSSANPKSDLDWTIHNAADTPGPNAYDTSLCPPPFIPPLR